MLVLTRKLMEKLYIGGDICVTVVRLEGGQVRLGIDAPKHVAVVRAELLPKRDEGVLPPPSPATYEVRADLRRVYAPGLAVDPPSRPVLKTPPSWARETDSRRRGPSR